MSFMIAVPEMLTEAATNLASLGSADQRGPRAGRIAHNAGIGGR